MGNWGPKTFESDDALDFVGGIYEEHKEGKEKDDFLFREMDKSLDKISTTEFLEMEDSVSVEVSAYIFSELINYDEKRIKESLKDLEEELQDECEGGYKLDLTKDIYKIIEEVEEKDGFIPNEMYIDLCLYKNKNYNIGEDFLYKLLLQLNNLLSGNSANYEEWFETVNYNSINKKNFFEKVLNYFKKGKENIDKKNINDFDFWFDLNKGIFLKLKNGLLKKSNRDKIENIEKSLNKDNEKVVIKNEKNNIIQNDIEIKMNEFDNQISKLKLDRKNGLITNEEYNKKYWKLKFERYKLT